MLPSANPIPDWDFSGVIPPIDDDEEPSSPYEVSLRDVVMRFGDTDERRRLLRGLLDFRAELHNAGLVRGFQWIDGSFVENIEDVEGRSPRDVDVVTFLYVPNPYTQESFIQAFPSLFDHNGVKDIYEIDSYFVPLNQTRPENIVDWSVYWNSRWSHRRGDFLWKGYLQIDLASDGDTEARTELERFDGMGGQ